MKSIHIAALFCASSMVLSAAGPSVGQPVPKLGSVLPGAKIPATSGKVVLVDFWASWCVPCEASFACMNRLQSSYGTKGLVIIGISVDDEKSGFDTFVAKQKPSFSVVHDSTHKAAESFDPPGMPTSYLVDRKGNIRHIHKGFKGASTEKDYTTEIEALLAEK
jgi:peroxiredoxin